MIGCNRCTFLPGAKLVTALISVARTVSAELDNTQRQIDSEEKRPDNKRGAGKLEKLAEKRQEAKAILGDHHLSDPCFFVTASASHQ